LNTLGFDPIGMGANSSRYIRDDMVRSEKIIKEAKIRVD
jgi:hypothetical protein